MLKFKCLSLMTGLKHCLSNITKVNITLTLSYYYYYSVSYSYIVKELVQHDRRFTL